MAELVRAEIKSIFAAGLTAGPEQGDPAKWHPDDPEVFGLPLMIFIGSTDSASADAFDATVCSPRWVVGNLHHVKDWDLGADLDDDAVGDVVAGKQLLLMRRWDYEKLRASLDAFIATCSGPTWGDVANRIGRVLTWEFAWKYDDGQDRAAGIVK